ncbi:MAG: asparagine synthase (glutamine-hydrolyzing) [Nitrospiraceae bacterium]
MSSGYSKRLIYQLREGSDKYMCGIVGVFDVKGRSVDPAWIHGMNDSITHRGPDDSGTYVKQSIGLGMRRLSIIDVAGGHQPVYNETKTVWVVFNGEIYNHLELRRDLEKAGHRFYTHSDSETLVHLYEQYGVDGVAKLRGMFAYALWDEERERLFLVRDRFGIKPLYYSLIDGRLSFASELKAFFQLPWFSSEVNSSAIPRFLTYLYIPGPETIYRDVVELPPAHTLVYEKGQASVRRYWTLQYQSQSSVSFEEWAERFLYQFRDSVRSHLISDVPLGAFLSGGIDSSAIVGVMAQVSSKPVLTFSIGHEGQGAFQDERAFARVVAERFQTDHYEFVVTTDIKDVLSKLMRCFDQPFADSSAIPNYYVNQVTRQHVAVALSGLGGDEIGGGYERYLGMLWAELFRKLPALLRRVLGEKWIQTLPDLASGRPSISRLKRFLASAQKPSAERYGAFVTAFSAAERNQVLNADFMNSAKADSPEELIVEMFHSGQADSLLHNLLLCDMQLYLPGDLLTLTDRVSMYHSLEVRVPFLDHPLVELMAQVPGEYKTTLRSKKVLLKQAFKELLPASILHRKKLGFSVPLGLWLRTDLKGMMCDLLSRESLKCLPYLNQGGIDKIVSDHLAGRTNHENKLWALMNLVLWRQSAVVRL